jgi:hypothetical protein
MTTTRTGTAGGGRTGATDESRFGAALGGPRAVQPAVLRRIESAAVAALGLLLYARFGLGWPTFALLILAPDLAALGFLGGPRLGAAAYNLGHTYAVPALAAAAGLLSGVDWVLPFALIWTVHIAADRAIGYDLKDAAGPPERRSAAVAPDRRSPA